MIEKIMMFFGYIKFSIADEKVNDLFEENKFLQNALDEYGFMVVLSDFYGCREVKIKEKNGFNLSNVPQHVIDKRREIIVSDKKKRANVGD